MNIIVDIVDKGNTFSLGQSWSCQAGPPRSFMDVMKKDIQRVVVTEEDGEDRLR